MTLVDYGAADPAVSPAFDAVCVPSCTPLTCSCTQPYQHWTSTSRTFTEDAWAVSFSGGELVPVHRFTTDPSLRAHVRAVRGGI